MKTGLSTIAFLAVILAVIFSLALVLPQAHTGQDVIDESAVSFSASELSEADALGAIILVRQVRVTKDDKKKEEEQTQLAYVEDVLSRYE